MYKVRNTNDNKAAFGIFRNPEEVRSARSILNSMGFTNSDIAVLYPQRKGPQDFPQRQQSSIKKGAIIGAAIGGIILFVVSIFLTAQINSINTLNSIYSPPRISELMTLSLVGLFSGIILGAACGALAGIGIPERAGKRYGDYLDAGGILMSIHVDGAEKAHTAQVVLEHSGAQDINLIQEKEGWDMVYSKVIQNTHHPKQPVMDVEH